MSLSLVFMGYMNPVLHYGMDRFFARCREVGVSGIIVRMFLMRSGGGVVWYCPLWGGFHFHAANRPRRMSGLRGWRRVLAVSSTWCPRWG